MLSTQPQSCGGKQEAYMEMIVNKDHSHWHINMHGSFTFADNSRFRILLDALSPESTLPQEPKGKVAHRHPAKLTIDISKLDYIDSAALGMLLLLKEASKKISTHVILKGATGQVLKILQLAHFHNIFDMI